MLETQYYIYLNVKMKVEIQKFNNRVALIWKKKKVRVIEYFLQSTHLRLQS